MKMRMLCLPALFFSLTACATANIKGTEIPDTPDNRAVLQVFYDYAAALKEKKTEKIMELVSEKYLDHNGTDDAGDDIDYGNVRQFLESDTYQKLQTVNLYFIVKDLIVSEEKDSARILYYYEVRVKKERIVPPEESSSIHSDTEKWLKESDVSQLVLKKEGDLWKIVSGL